MTIKIEVEDINELFEVLSLISVAPAPAPLGDLPVELTEQGIENLKDMIPELDTPEEVNPPMIDNGLDSAGFKWDARIHSTGKTKTQSGEWRTKRKPNDINDAEWLTYIDQIRYPSTTQAPVPAAEPELPVMDISPEEAFKQTQSVSFTELLNKISEVTNNGDYVMSEIDDMLSEHDVEKITELVDESKEAIRSAIYTELTS